MRLWWLIKLNRILLSLFDSSCASLVAEIESNDLKLRRKLRSETHLGVKGLKAMNHSFASSMFYRTSIRLKLLCLSLQIDSSRNLHEANDFCASETVLKVFPIETHFHRNFEC
jgi:hypothetical protein